MEEKFCPCCGRHCSLDSPHCERGEEYSRSGSIPDGGDNRAFHGERSEHGGGRAYHGEHSEHGDNRAYHGEHSEHGGGRAFDRRQRYESLDTENKLVCNIRDLGHTVRAMSDGKASQNRVLIILGESKTMTQSELTERLCVQPGTASEVIGKLERAGFIVRAENEKDKRTCELRLTESGATRAAEASEERKKRYEEMFCCLSDEQKTQLLLLLEKVNNDWQDRYGDRKQHIGADGGEHSHCRHHGGHDGHDGHGRHFGRTGERK